ncbi:hypothetical protein HPB49_003210 [Dermacentor silvarum]|uniref:Uncharacterized protein n=1 Tax=Dermacentor silvarum TaxID=543639 RepID=A0ACB8D250_DERSI|nr:hypothetical protein HPB49_003210 [Dermacentor silvarum]
MRSRIVREVYQRGGVAARSDEEVLVWNVSTLRALDKFLASENRRMLLNYLGWRVVALLGPATTVDMMNARHAFYMAKFGAEDQPQLLGFCFEQAARMLPVAVGRMAYRAVGGGGDSAQRLVSRMVEEIRASLLLLLRGSDVSWLNEQSKEIAIKKVRTLCRAVRMFSIGDTDIVPLQIRRLRLIQQPINSTTLDWEPPVS